MRRLRLQATAGTVLANLNYTLRYSQTAEFGQRLGDWQTSSTFRISCNITNGNERLPFTMNYTGGYTWTIVGPRLR